MPSPFPTSAVDAPNRNAALFALAARTGVFVLPVPGPGEDEDQEETPIGDPDEDDWEGEDWDEDDDDPIQVRPVRQIVPAKRL
jgi:hypothetical protein